jgi:hypothetical protein
MRWLFRRFRLILCLWLAAPLGLAGCTDALTRPEVALLAPENAAVLQLLTDLPALPQLLARTLAPSGRLPSDSARLASLTPRAVAIALIGDAERRLERGEGGGDEGARVTRERARHLLRGAAEAVEGEDYPRAIRRAYYASQLLEALEAGSD